MCLAQKASKLTIEGEGRITGSNPQNALVRHRPRLQRVTFLAQLFTGFFQKLFKLCRIGIGTAWNLFAANTGIGAVDDGQAEFAVAVLWGPGHSLIWLECAVGNQKSFVDTERGVHGIFSLYAQSSDVPSVGLTVRLVTCTDARNRGVGHIQLKEISTFFLRFKVLAGFER